MSIIIVCLSSAITITEGLIKLKGYYGDTLGYKNALYKKIGRLATQTQIDYFSSVLGPPVFKEVEKKHILFTYVFDLFYVVARTDFNNTVLSYSVTTRSESFNPVLSLGPYEEGQRPYRIVLGKTKFSEIPFVPEDIFLSIGAKNFYFYEMYYFGAQANYQSYIFSFNEAGAGRADVSDLGLDIDLHYNKKLNDLPDTFKNFRSRTVVNTYGVGESLGDEDIATAGPDLGQVEALYSVVN
ncbi:MAG: hypothetical protein HGA87_02790 [Desulfobulbaceae bacterium]|nr:hypothetical protein [Desulfobulbaceae bacterium]